MKKISSFILIILMICSLTLAHSGRTDGKGGHYNRSTGEYHYHHEYPAHDHENGICPYANKTANSNSSTSSSSGIIKDNKENKVTLGGILSGVVLFVLFGIPYIVAIAYFPIIILISLWDWIKNKFNKK